MNKRIIATHRGFTLIELLVVIAIICLLIAILFPVFETARDKANAATCMSNLKQVMSAMTQYCDDNDNFYPAQDGCYSTGGPLPAPGVPSTATGCGPTDYGDRLNHYKWWWWLYPYTKSLGVFFCPSRPLGNKNSLASTDWANSAEIDNGYGLNISITGTSDTYDNGSGPNGTGVGSYPPYTTGGTVGNSFLTENYNSNYGTYEFRPTPMSAVPEPDKTLLITEMYGTCITAYMIPTQNGRDSIAMASFPAADRGYWNKVFKFAPWANSMVSSTTAVDYSPNKPLQTAAPHEGGVEVAYCDGHVKWLSVDQFLANCPPYEQYFPTASPKWYPAIEGNNAPDRIKLTTQNPSLTATGRDWPMWALYRSQFP